MNRYEIARGDTPPPPDPEIPKTPEGWVRPVPRTESRQAPTVYGIGVVTGTVFSGAATWTAG